MDTKIEIEESKREINEKKIHCAKKIEPLSVINILVYIINTN